MPLSWPAKDPDVELDYQVDWGPWLAGDTIASSTWTVPSGITKTRDATSATATTIWLSGGAIGSTYQIINRITTAGGRTDERTIDIMITDK